MCIFYHVFYDCTAVLLICMLQYGSYAQYQQYQQYQQHAWASYNALHQDYYHR